jgi:hypothetical protein
MLVVSCLCTYHAAHTYFDLSATRETGSERREEARARERERERERIADMCSHI